MSAPMTHDPLVVNTKDGVVWQRRAVTADGRGLYAVVGSCSCPVYKMATLAELAEHGVAGSADVLPMPVGPQADPVAAGRALDLLTLMDERAASKVSPVLAAVLDEAEALRAQVASLLAERRSTNESVDEAAKALREQRDRIAELEESPLAWAEKLDAKSLDNFLICMAQATEYEPMSGAVDEIHELIRSFREHVGRVGHDVPETGGAS